MRLANSVTVVLCTLIALAIDAVYADTSPPIQVQLRSPWPSPPLLLEILESVYEEEPRSFFTLVSHLTSPWALTGEIVEESLASRTIGSTLQQASEETILYAARRILDERDLLQGRGQKHNFELSLALKSQSPKIAAFWQLYDTNGLQKRWEEAKKEGECGSWVDFAGKVICSREELTEAFESYNKEIYQIDPPIVPFDHIFSSSPEQQATSPTAVLYGDPFSANFWSLHIRLTEYALGSRLNSPPLQYVLRWKPLANLNDSYLAGYGAYLDLKKVDYLVIDDRKLTDTSAVLAKSEGILPVETQDSLEDQRWMDKQLKTSEDDRKQSIGNLSEEELADLAIKAAYSVVSAKDPIKALRQLSQNFPRYGVALARSAPSPSKAFLDEVQNLQEATIQGGANGVFLNGKVVMYKEFQPIGLLPLLRSERAIINALTALNLSTSNAVELLTSPEIAKVYSPEEAKVDLFDASDRIERGSVTDDQRSDKGVITYWNDLEREGDPRYIRWSQELRSILRPMYPGSFPVIRRNLFNIIMITDMANVDSCTFIADTVQLATTKLAIRWGIVPSNLKDEHEPSLQLARFFWLAVDEGGVEVAAKYLRRVAAASSGDKISIEVAEKELRKILHLSSAEIQEKVEQYSQREKITRAYLQRLRADDSSAGHVFVNGQYMAFGPQTFQFIHQAVATQVQMVAAPIYYGQLQDEDDVSTYFYDLPGTHSSRSELLFPSDDSPVRKGVVELNEATFVRRKFISPANEQVNSTVWIAGDLDSKAGVKLLRDVVEVLNKAKTRLGLVHIPDSSTPKQSSMLLSTFLYQLLTSSATVTPDQLLEVLDSYQTEGYGIEATTGEQTISQDGAASINHMKAQGWTEPQVNESADYWTDDVFAKKLKLDKDDFALIINGKVISKFRPEDLSNADYQAFFQKEAAKVDTIAQLVSSMITVNPDTTTRAGSVLEKAYFVDASLEGIFEVPSTARSTIIDGINFKETAFTLGDKDTASLRFSILLDPISETAQIWSSILEMLSGFDDVFVKVILNPTPVLKELPIKRYYRHSAPHRLTFDAQGQVKAEMLTFAEMPTDAVLTMGLDAPPSWLTMAADAIYDLDNIRLKDVVTPSVSVIYDLKYILIEGHAREESAKGTPRGLQIVLETMDGSEQLDTIVMANLAYFQFRAKPGLYRLRLRQGRSTELFDMISVGNAGFDSPRVEVTGQSITLSTLQGLTIYPRLARKKGKEREILVEEEGGGREAGMAKEVIPQGISNDFLSRAKGILQSVTGKASHSSNTATDIQKQAAINVFTVASGHLYERMTYIMILSVLKHTSSTVKFWFIENFLSPSFKDFIPHLAQEYGFEYELITYAWPHWLRAQKEKQRSIWGMKVLFLDVIFPLSLSKVIFVDADQIVRADLQELIDIDLHGAPYGFPPMGNDSYDMDNFRFWEQKGGYWENFLRGKPYPISALFVVDLNKFRLQAAGDKLRGNYQALTQDPNSLSNLDQDLVASMIHVVEIHSLEKEWLWCETWCSWDWYNQAKSIDLCSNPKTKEPKLDRAKRQIPEWTVYDDEVARAAIKFKEQGKLGANVVAPASNPIKETKITPRVQEAISHDEL